jgi:hypothetical protein
MSTALADELHTLLQEEPSELAFRAVCSLLDTWPGDNRDALALAVRALASWPDECRWAPWSWCCALAAGEHRPTWSLVRAVGVRSHHIGCSPILLRTLSRDCVGPLITHLHLDRYGFLDDNDGATLLTEDPGRWPALEEVGQLDCTDDSLRSFLASDLLARLQDVEVFLPSHPSSANPVPGFTRPADNLRQLLIHFRHPKDIRPLLAVEFLPRLRGLSLLGEWFTEEKPQDHYQQLANLPLLTQIDRLLLAQLRQDVVLKLLARADLHLQRLELRNREYVTNLVDYQQNACRLNEEGVRALGKCGSLAGLTHLAVHNERVGDSILQLVEATTPGSLEMLELSNVNLTDKGVARLAQLPQLAGVSVLNLQENLFTFRGLETLLRSPHLGRLRRLHLGGMTPYSPYYAAGSCQVLGDHGAAALGSSGLLSQLEELVLCSAEIGPRGAAALARVDAPNLRRLDLSNNTLEAEGAGGLAAGGLLLPLRELDLSICQLDDLAMQHLSGIGFTSLRELGLAYNSIGPAGARRLAEADGLARLWRLNLHDNFIGDEGLIALAGSPHLGRLVELDLEQDVWNYRATVFNDEAARIVAGSRTFARLDALFAGEVDEYTGGRYRHPFSRQGLEAIRAATRLRAEVLQALAAAEGEHEGEAVPQEQPAGYFHHYTPREVERQRRQSDFRGLPAPEVAMDERQWLESTDPAWMLEFLGERASPRQLRLFACACARRVLPLHPDDRLVALIEVGERLADGTAGEEERKAALAGIQAADPYDPSQQLRMSVRAAACTTLNESARESATWASKQAIQAAIADMRQRQRGSVASVSYIPEHAAQAALVRCIFGNPHRPARLDPTWLRWNDGTVPSIARSIYQERAFDRLPILADALEEAGCTDADILAHCRSRGEHVCGCWVVDLAREGG